MSSALVLARPDRPVVAKDESQQRSSRIVFALMRRQEEVDVRRHVGILHFRGQVVQGVGQTQKVKLIYPLVELRPGFGFGLRSCVSGAIEFCRRVTSMREFCTCFLAYSIAFDFALAAFHRRPLALERHLHRRPGEILYGIGYTTSSTLLRARLSSLR